MAWIEYMSFASGTWLNEPSIWSLDDGRLQVVADPRTDFWRETHYGFTRDTGHFFGCEISGPFTAQLRVRARYEALYDQAGLMVRVDEARWIKAGIEWSDGAPNLGSVLTVDRSDWATGSYDGDPAEFWLRATVANGAIRVQASNDGARWPLLRLAPFPETPTYHVGPMCCTPERAGWRWSSPASASGLPSGRNCTIFPERGYRGGHRRGPSRLNEETEAHCIERAHRQQRPLRPSLAAFARQHPEIELDIHTSDEPVNLTNRQADVALPVVYDRGVDRRRGGTPIGAGVPA